MNNESSILERTADLATSVKLRNSFAVLVVDDEATNAVLLSEVLKQEGFTCDYSLSAQEALERPDIGTISLVVTDIRMPGMSGVELAESLQNRGDCPRIIFITAQAELQVISRAMTLQPFGYMEKPFSIVQFRELVERAFQEYCEEATHHQTLVNLADEVKEQEKELEFRTERLVSEQELIQGIIGNATFGLIAVDDQLQTYLLNEVATNLLQLKLQSTKTYLGVPLIDLLPAECSQDVMDLCTTVITSGQLLETNFRNPLTERLHSIVSYPVWRRQTINAAVLVIHDVTDKDILQKRLLQSAKLASIGELAAGIAHEINNPLGFVTSNCNTLAGYVDAITKYLHALENNSKDPAL